MTSHTSPRDGSTMLANTPWLARMIDKARLSATGHIAEYDLDYPCPMDQRLLAQLGLDGKTFQTIVMAAENDEAIIAELKKREAIPV